MQSFLTSSSNSLSNRHRKKKQLSRGIAVKLREERKTSNADIIIKQLKIFTFSSAVLFKRYLRKKKKIKNTITHKTKYDFARVFFFFFWQWKLYALARIRYFSWSLGRLYYVSILTRFRRHRQDEMRSTFHCVDGGKKKKNDDVRK